MAPRHDEAARLLPEQAILRACARPSLRPDDAWQIEQASRAVNWDALLHLAQAHAVSYFVHRHLPAIAPPLVRERLETQVREQTLFAMTLLGQQFQVAAELERCAVAAVWL